MTESNYDVCNRCRLFRNAMNPCERCHQFLAGRSRLDPAAVTEPFDAAILSIIHQLETCREGEVADLMEAVVKIAQQRKNAVEAQYPHLRTGRLLESFQ